MKFWYLPLEAYVERYTYLMSGPGGWTETQFRQSDVNFEAIRPVQSGDRIKTGSVLDTSTRHAYATGQVTELLRRIDEIADDDWIWVEDFWQPGIESLFMARHQLKKRFQITPFLHAQTIDEADFTYPMRRWMRPIEQGFAEGYDLVRFASEILAQRYVDTFKQSLTHVADHYGLPYNESHLINWCADQGIGLGEKEPYVMFSSRLDPEKNPEFLAALALKMPDVQFVIACPRQHLSAKPSMNVLLKHLMTTVPNLKLVDTSNKVDYYRLLSKAKVQFNCATQDWVSWTLLEALTFRCKVVYPNERDFAYLLPHTYNGLTEAEEMIRSYLNDETSDLNQDWYKKIRKHNSNSVANWISQIKEGRCFRKEQPEGQTFL